MNSLSEKVVGLLGRNYTVKKAAIWTEDVLSVKALLGACPKLQSLVWIREVGTSLEESFDKRLSILIPADRKEYCFPVIPNTDLIFIECNEKEGEHSGWQRRMYVAKDFSDKSKFVVSPNVWEGHPWYKNMFEIYKSKIALTDGTLYVGVGSQKVNVSALKI